MTAPSTARRYRQDHGPIVFGAPGFDVRWNRLSRVVVIEPTGDPTARLTVEGDPAEMLLLALAAAHRQGRMAETLRRIMEAVALALACQDEWYRCGTYMLRRPAWQQRDHA